MPSSPSAVLSQDDAEPATASGRHSPTDPKETQQKGPPNWWDPPPRIHIDQRYKEQVWLLGVTQLHLCFQALWLCQLFVCAPCHAGLSHLTYARVCFLVL